MTAETSYRLLIDVSRPVRCASNRAVRGRVVASGFGASDCRAGCGAHLKYLG